MAESDKKELSMDEILASIRSILQETTSEAPKGYNEEEEVFDLSNSMMVEGVETDEEKSDFDVSAKVFDDELIEIIDDDVEDIVKDLELDAGIFSGVEEDFKLDDNLDIAEDIVFEQSICVPDIKEVETKNPDCAEIEAKQDKVIEDISAEIIGSFAKLFDEHVSVHSKGVANVSYDADKLLETIIKRTVEEKISNELVFNVIKEKIIPVLDAWLKMYLPKIVEKEVERVMVKVDRS